MMILDRYIASSYLKGMIPVMLLLLSLFSFLSLAEELEEVGQGTFRLIDAFLVVLYTSPRRIVDLMPVTALLGGLLGLALGAGTSALLAKYAGWQTVVTSGSAIMAFGFSAAVGMIFGIWPAKRAASLDPIDALRHE